MTDLLAADTAMGAVTLNVADLDAMTAYYRDGVGLQVLSAEGSRVELGRAGGVRVDGDSVAGDRAGGDTAGGDTAPLPGRPLIVLEHTPQLRHASPHDAGLFHTAILFDSREALAAAVYSVARLRPGSFTGSSDHLVSQAFYFDDPEGNGVELYWDRDRTAWSWTHGRIEMSTLYLDPNAFLQEHLTERGLEGAGFGDAVVGHVHLSVGDIDSARDFYVRQLGFASTIEMPGSALFVSAGGYHHHMAMNVWRSTGAGRRQQTLGLGRVDIAVPTADDLGELDERMRHHGIPIRDDGRTLAIDDPWANLIRVTVAETVGESADGGRG